MLDEQDRQRVVVAEPQDEVAELLDLLVVEARRPARRAAAARGLRQQRAGDLDALLGPVRQRRRRLAGAAAEADVVERLERVRSR